MERKQNLMSSSAMNQLRKSVKHLRGQQNVFSPRLNEVIRVCLLTYCSWRVVRQLKRFLASPSSRLFHLPAPNGPACPRFLYHLPPCEDMRHSLDQQLIGNGEVSSPITARGNSIPVKISFKSKISFFFYDWPCSKSCSSILHHVELNVLVDLWRHF